MGETLGKKKVYLYHVDIQGSFSLSGISTTKNFVVFFTQLRYI